MENRKRILGVIEDSESEMSPHVICYPNTNIMAEDEGKSVGIFSNDNVKELVFDRTYKDALDMGMSPEWVAKEFDKYQNYQKVKYTS